MPELSSLRSIFWHKFLINLDYTASHEQNVHRPPTLCQQIQKYIHPYDKSAQRETNARRILLQKLISSTTRKN
jgi:hypothetical protein